MCTVSIDFSVLYSCTAIAERRIMAIFTMTKATMRAKICSDKGAAHPGQIACLVEFGDTLCVIEFSLLLVI